MAVVLIPNVATSIGGVGTATPLMDGTAAVGTAAAASHEDHVHPSDTSKADAATVQTSPTAYFL